MLPLNLPSLGGWGVRGGTVGQGERQTFHTAPQVCDSRSTLTQMHFQLAGVKWRPEGHPWRKYGIEKKHSFLIWFGLVAKWCLTLAIPWTAAFQASLSMGFSRQEYWSRLPFLTPEDLPNPGIVHRWKSPQVPHTDRQVACHAFLWDWHENWPFSSLGHYWVFQICWHIECSILTAPSFRILTSSTGSPSPPLALFVMMFPKAHLGSHSRMSGFRWVITPSWLSGSLRSFCIVLLCILATSS